MKASEFYKQKTKNNLQLNCGVRLTGEELFTLMKEYAQSQQSEISVTDEEIDNYYPNEAPPMAFNSKYANFFKVEGAKAMRDGRIKANG